MLDVVYEDNHLLVVNKPAGIVTQGAAEGDPSLVEAAKAYLRQRYGKPGNVYLGVVSRLDRMATGVLVFARTSKAAARLNDQFRARLVRKTYWALVPGDMLPNADECVDYLRKDEATHRVVTCSRNNVHAKLARLTYRLPTTIRSGASLLEVLLETGRKHQIRVQLASRGFPVLGDVKYCSDVVFPQGIALHARLLELSHPVTKQPLTFETSVDRRWASFVP